MKALRVLLAALVAVLPGCASVGALQAMEARILERAAAEDAGIIEIASQELAATRSQLEEQIESQLETTAAGGGAIGAAALVALNFWRNRTRKNALGGTPPAKA